MSSFVFSSVALYEISGSDIYFQNAELALKYLVKTAEVKKNSSSFNAFPLLSTLFVSKNIEFNEKLTKFIGSFEFYPPLTPMPQRANNFFAYKALAHILRFNIFDFNEISPSRKNDFKEGMHIIDNYLLSWQFSDGFFYDKPQLLNSKHGLSHNTYHATMMMVMSFMATFSSNSEYLKSVEKAIFAMESITSPSGEAFAFGRSNNTLFGYANAILGLSLFILQKPKNTDYLIQFRKLLFEFVCNNHFKGQTFSIVPYYGGNKRIGFDKYMFSIVYNSYSLSILLLTEILYPFINNND